MDAVVRPEYVRIALESMRGMHSVLDKLTEAELREVLRVESQSSRRVSLMDRIVGRLINLKAEELRRELLETYYGQKR